MSPQNPIIYTDKNKKTEKKKIPHWRKVIISKSKITSGIQNKNIVDAYLLSQIIH